MRSRGLRRPVPGSGLFTQALPGIRCGLAIWLIGWMYWRMPPLALLKPVPWSSATRLGMIVPWGYLGVAVLLVIVQAIQLAGG